MKKKGLFVRIITGVLMLALALASFLWSPWLFGAVFTWMVWLLTEEIFKMLVHGPRYRKEKWCIYVAVVSFAILTFLHLQIGLHPRWLFLIVIPVLAAAFFMLFDCCSDYDFNLGIFFPLLYVLIPMGSMLPIAFHGEGGQFDGLLLLMLMAMIWMNDIGAYCIGMSFGQKPDSKKFFPSLSPKKSWAGFWGGMIFTFASAIVLWALFGQLPLIHWIVLALICSVLGIFGDLFESLIKRHAAVKDAGRIMPGHGGALDRMDSALYLLPIFLLYLEFFGLI